jgi:AraC-like DNA-binding protein
MIEPSGAELLSIIRPAALPDTELMVARNSMRKWRVFHERYVVCVCTRASSDWHYRGRRRFMADGEYALMEPGETHVNTVVARPQDYTVLHIAPAAFEQAASEIGIGRAPHFAVIQGTSRTILRAFERLCAAIGTGETALEQQSRFALCVQLLFENCIERAAPAVRDRIRVRTPIERAKLYLRDRFNESVSLDELAGVAGLSRFHLLRTFAAQVGLPPHAYQVRMRIERACLMLNAGTPPSAAATALGFADQSHFTRHFRAVTGVTPGAYARAAR